MANAAAETRLSSILHGELRRVVRSVLAHNRQDCVLETAAVLNEIFLRIAPYRRQLLSSPGEWQSRAHFMMAAAPQLRDTIRSFACRNGATRQSVGLGFGSPPPGEPPMIYDFFSVDRLLTTLAASEANLATTLELVCFGGLTDREVAFVLNIPLAKATRDRECAWNWLLKKMSGHMEKQSGENTTAP